MDKLELITHNRQNDNYQFKSVTILVNGQDIIDLLKAYELPFAKKEGSGSIAGGYDGLSPVTLLKHLTNPAEFDENGKVSILECECGCDGCWPMKIKIIELVDKIVWTDFEQPYRTIDSHNFWDYATFGQFSFDIQNYQEQLEKLRQAEIDRQVENEISIW